MAATSNKFLYYQSIFSTIHTTHFTGWINQQLASQLNRLLSSLSAATGYQAQKQSVSKDAQACCLVPHIPKKRFTEVSYHILHCAIVSQADIDMKMIKHEYL